MPTTITTQIVNLTAQVTVAPTPSSLQQSGALVSVGGTTLTAGTYQFYGTLASLQAALSAAGNYAELDNMAATFFAQGTSVGVYVLELGVQTTIPLGIAALQTWITDNPGILYSFCVPADWDTLPAAASTTVNGVVDAGSTLPAGTYYTQVAYVNAAGAIGNLSPMATTTIATGYELTVTSPPALTGATDYLVYIGTSQTALYLQNGSGTAIGTNYSQVAALLTATSPTETLADLANASSSASGKTYFFPTTTQTNLTSYSGYKAAYATVESPTVQAGEFDAAAMMYQWLVNNPSASTPLAPMAYRYLTGVNAWPQTGYSTQTQAILSAYGNLVYTGAEGGISNSLIMKGTTMDGSQASWWYGVDWFQIQVKQALAAAIINGSNSNPPLVYDQAGINTLLKVAQNVANSAITFNCALSITITATPFYTYSQQNPTNYKAGIYNGFSATVVGLNGFETITFALDAVEFVA